MTLTIADPLRLACGTVLSNRLCKAALTEGLADQLNRATDDLCNLYRLWSEGGAGLVITGNVQIDRSHLERAGNVVIDGNGGFDALRRLAAAGRVGGNHFWMQINHPGRQTPGHINASPLAPSSVALQTRGNYGVPRELTEPQILDFIGRFAKVALTAREAGFTGVQVHAAHGYLLSQFLSAKSNLRDDDWGGPIANRARFLLEVVRAIRRAVGADFPIGVKLNSADFQAGGFTEEESAQVAQWLSQEKVDLLELSGGNYERPSMAGIDAPESTRHREAYFLDFAAHIRRSIEMPLMVTGGFRTSAAMNAAVQSGDTDMIGLGRPMCVEPDLPHKLLKGVTAEAWLGNARAKAMQQGLGSKEGKLSTSASGSYYYTQLINMARTGSAILEQSVFDAHQVFMLHEKTTFEALEAFPPSVTQ